MKKLFFLMMVIIMVASLSACQRTVTEKSEELTESAVVEDVVFSPSSHGSGVGPSIDMTGKGGIGIAVTSVSVPEKYAVVFRCQHGKFIVQGTSRKHQELWKRLVRDQEVTVYYHEIYHVTYDGDEVISRELVDYDFIDAR